MPKFAPEGIPYFVVFGAITIAVGYFGGIFAIIPGLVLAFMFYFFRDPERETPQGEGLYVSTADGKVLITGPVHEKDYLDADCVQVSIFMSPLDVHVNRAPCNCVVMSVKYNKGSFKKAFSEEAFKKNENISTVVEEEDGLTGRRIFFRQVAGSIAQKAVFRKRPGDHLRRGERFGMIKFSSRMDIFLPPDVRLRVKPGDRVRAGETVIAERIKNG